LNPLIPVNIARFSTKETGFLRNASVAAPVKTRFLAQQLD
jgi:hypothetical protein